MAKPTATITEWATDAGATSDPGPTRRATGFIAGKKLPAKWLNWLLNQNAQWLTYLRDLHTEPEFLNKVYHWTATHRFASGFAANHWGVSGEVLYAEPATGGTILKERTIRLPHTAFCAEQEPEGGVLGWHMIVRDEYPNNGWSKHVNYDTGLYGEIALPTGATLVRVVARVEGIAWLGVDSSIQLSTGLAQIEGDFLKYRTVEKNSGPLQGTTLLTVDAAIDLPWLGPFDGSHQTLLVRFTGLGSVVVDWVQVTFMDPGPRNY
jgi:hypothetical protein